MGFLDTIFDTIFPLQCIVCGKSEADLCLKCLYESPSAERETAKWIFSIFDYRHPPIKKALWLLKYKGKKNLAGIFAETMYGRILEELAELSMMENFRDSILIPIPLSSKRYRERGFNQAELICQKLIELQNSLQAHFLKRLSQADEPRMSEKSADFYATVQKVAPRKSFVLEKNILIKIKETKHQAQIKDRRERLKNLAGSLAIKNAELIKSRNIILIDDVTTTGATLNEAKKILKQSGAGKVIAFTVAH